MIHMNKSIFFKVKQGVHVEALKGSAYWHIDGVVETVVGPYRHSRLKSFVSFGVCFHKETTNCFSHRIHIQTVGDVQSHVCCT